MVSYRYFPGAAGVAAVSPGAAALGVEASFVAAAFGPLAVSRTL